MDAPVSASVPPGGMGTPVVASVQASDPLVPIHVKYVPAALPVKVKPEAGAETVNAVIA